MKVILISKIKKIDLFVIRTKCFVFSFVSLICFLKRLYRTINVNLKAVFNVTQTLLPFINDGGSIVNVSSVASLRALANHSAYSASKAGVDALTKSFALELGPRKIRVNSVNPTVGKTNYFTNY